MLGVDWEIRCEDVSDSVVLMVGRVIYGMFFCVLLFVDLVFGLRLGCKYDVYVRGCCVFLLVLMWVDWCCLESGSIILGG